MRRMWFIVLFLLAGCSESGVSEGQFEINFERTEEEIRTDLDRVLNAQGSDDLVPQSRAFISFRKIDLEIYQEMEPPAKYKEVHTLLVQSLESYVSLGESLEDLAYDSETDVNTPYREATEKLEEAKEVYEQLGGKPKN